MADIEAEAVKLVIGVRDEGANAPVQEREDADDDGATGLNSLGTRDPG